MTPSTATVPALARAADLYGRGLHGTETQLLLREEDGSAAVVPVGTYLGPLTAADHEVLDRAEAPVLDVGCGPGRHVVALEARGVRAVGVDASPVAVEVARERGAAVIQASVFASVPGAGSWGSALLLDGNIGIGGSPVRLLGRLRALLAPGGTVLAELDVPGTPLRSGRVRLEGAAGVSDWFPWARVGVDSVDGYAELAGLQVAHAWEVQGRWFAELVAR